MFSVCGVISSTQLSGGHVGLLEYAATAGLSVVVVVYSIGHISGAHLNPSITIAFALFGGFPWSQVLLMPPYSFTSGVELLFHMQTQTQELAAVSNSQYL